MVRLASPMGSSLGFGPNPSDCTPYSDSLSLRLRVFSLNLATEINSQAHSPRGTLSGIVRHLISAVLNSLLALQLFVGFRFQVLFHSPNRGTFHLSLTVLVHYRSPNVFSLGEWTPRFLPD